MSKETLETYELENIWHEDLAKLFYTVARLIKGNWTWGLNNRCKYITISIDMRNGGYVLYDRNRKRILPEDLEWQYSDENPLPPSEQTPAPAKGGES